MTDLYYPLRSLREGNWFKLICGASFQHLPAIRNLVFAYALAGADCVDVAADPAVILAAKDAIADAIRFAQSNPHFVVGEVQPPWLMVSFNDGEDPHFRKAEFDPAACPEGCPRPCEAICPAQAITFSSSPPTQNPFPIQPGTATTATSDSFSGVISDRCYGCGRCLPICPIQHIATRAYVSTPTAIAPLVIEAGVDAIEIHTQVGRLEDFRRLWSAIAPWLHHLKLVAISCPDGEELIDYLWALHDLISPLPGALVWQTDGRPMSGDIGTGATRAAVKLGQKVLAAKLPGYVQLAGGTNHHTVPKLRSLGLLNSSASSVATFAHLTEPPSFIAGVAYGSYARALLSPVLDQLEAMGVSSFPLLQEVSPFPMMRLEESPFLGQAVELARSLVSPLKTQSRSQSRL